MVRGDTHHCFDTKPHHFRLVNVKYIIPINKNYYNSSINNQNTNLKLPNIPNVLSPTLGKVEGNTRQIKSKRNT
jgi:hypothetical protein